MKTGLMENYSAQLTEYMNKAWAWLISPAGYLQFGLILASFVLAYFLAKIIGRRMVNLTLPKVPAFFGDLTGIVAKIRELLFQIISVLLLSGAVEICRAATGQSHIVRLMLGVSVILLIYGVIKRFIKTKMIVFLAKWIGIPVAILQIFGVLDEVTQWLDSIDVDLGSIRLSLYALVRALIFGSILFWLGRLSNDTGKKVIRGRPDLDTRTRELASKLFEIGLFVVIFILLLQIIGIPLTALAVFGGAVGVGLGFGLQSIASNFISGIIILLDKSITIGDYIELEDGRGGVIREMSMRSATLETYDGKDIMVPNETFITSSFTNWTHHDPEQRYDIRFQVAYSTDIPAMIDIIREIVSSHPQVLSGEGVPKEQWPDAEIESFGDSGIDILVEFWMKGIDDGANRVGADLNLMIWMALKQHNIEIPFPQREVRMLND